MSFRLNEFKLSCLPEDICDFIMCDIERLYGKETLDNLAIGKELLGWVLNNQDTLYNNYPWIKGNILVSIIKNIDLRDFSGVYEMCPDHYKPECSRLIKNKNHMSKVDFIKSTNTTICNKLYNSKLNEEYKRNTILNNITIENTEQHYPIHTSCYISDYEGKGFSPEEEVGIHLSRYELDNVFNIGNYQVREDPRNIYSKYKKEINNIYNRRRD